MVGEPGEEALRLLVLPLLPRFVWRLARTLRQVLETITTRFIINILNIFAVTLKHFELYERCYTNKVIIIIHTGEKSIKILRKN